MILTRVWSRFAPSPASPSPAAGVRVTRPAHPPVGWLTGDARSLGTLRRFETAVMPELGLRGVPDSVHGGSDDLGTWPPSPVELDIAGRWLDSGDPAVRDELYLVASSQDRAAAIGELLYSQRREIAARELLDRVFGPEVQA